MIVRHAWFLVWCMFVFFCFFYVLSVVFYELVWYGTAVVSNRFLACLRVCVRLSSHIIWGLVCHEYLLPGYR